MTKSNQMARVVPDDEFARWFPSSTRADPRVPRHRWMAISMVLQAVSLATMLAEDLGLGDVARRLTEVHEDLRKIRDAA